MNIPKFKNKKLYEQVFTHRSYLNEAKEEIESNERIEFLGDSILSFIVSSFIFKNYKDLDEGKLTNIRSILTNTNSLNDFAKELDLGKYLRLSKGEEATGGRSNKTIIADTLEALIGGVYLDQGINEARKFVEELMLKDIDKIVEKGELKDAKSKLQEKIQEEYKTSPSYKTMKEEGPDHAKVYTVGVYLKDNLLATGVSSSKQEAEKKAAEKAISKI